MSQEQTAELLSLILASASEDESQREPAVSALEDFGVPPESAAPQLVNLLHEQDQADVLYWAATLLGRLEEKAAPYTSQLAALLESTKPLNARERAAWALGMIGPGAKAALPALEKAASGQEPRLARLASQAVAAMQK